MDDLQYLSMLPSLYPQFAPDYAILEKYQDQLRTQYDDYVGHVSPASMAISLQTSAYILWIAEQVGARTAIDFGSGFTSYALRQVCDDVTSVDNADDWLEWTKVYCKRYGCDFGQFVLADRIDDTFGEYDLVVYDFSSGELRDGNFDRAVGCIARGGIGIMDDAMHEGHLRAMQKACEHHRCDLFGLQNWTMDEFCRYAALVVRP